MKKIFLILSVIAAFAFTCLSVFASGNYLRTITLEKNNAGYNIVLSTDKAAKIIKSSPSQSELILELKGVTSSDTVNALYKGVSNIDNFVVENVSPNRLKVYIKADNIKNATVVMNPVNGQSTVISDTFPINKTAWAGFVLLLLYVIFRISSKSAQHENSILIKRDIKDREIELYRRYRKNINSNPSIYSQDKKFQNMLRKIDRKIDERLASSIK